MNILRRVFFVFLPVFFVFLQCDAKTKPRPEKYGITISIDKAAQRRAVSDSMRQMLLKHPQVIRKKTVYNIEREHVMNDKTVDFYMLLFVCIMLGIIRYMDPKYFYDLWRAFLNPTLSSRQLREQMEGTTLQNLLMNIFFAIITGSYIFYAVRLVTPGRTGNIPPPLLLIMLIAGVMVIYLAKYAVIRFSGWVFKLEGITEHYIFNIFLINKLLSLMLLPFVLILAFADTVWTGPAIIISLILAGLLLLNRYTRSWQVFGSFFQYSKFHFFTYLCASELLPLAVLMKLLVRGFLY
jgi:hypothetical protein